MPSQAFASWVYFVKEDAKYTDIRSGRSLGECEFEVDILMCYDEDIQRQVAQ